MTASARDIVLVSGSGKTGRRIAHRLAERAIPHRSASRNATPPFDWEAEEGWEQVVSGAAQLYVAYHPELAMPGAAEKVGTLGRIAARAGVEHVVLLSGRGEPQAVRGEEAMRESGIPTTVLRAAWFGQNFSEGAFLPSILEGTIALPGAAKEPFVDAEDIADVAVACLVDASHRGRTYELTGPRLVGFDEVARTITVASGRAVSFVPVSRDAFVEGASASMPREVAAFLGDLFCELLDGHNAHVSNDVATILGRPARDVDALVREAARAGAFGDGRLSRGANP